MKESIGATWIFVICLTFIILFTGYIAISVNYAKAFKIKSHMVSELEQNSGLSGIQQKLETYLTSEGYVAYGECPMQILVGADSTDWQRIECFGEGSTAPAGNCNACIYSRKVETANDDIEGDRCYYRVTTFFTFDLPVVNVLIPSIKVSGDSQYIYTENDCR